MNRVDPTGMEWYWNDDGTDPVWIDGDQDVDGYTNHNTDAYQQGGEEDNYQWIHYGSTDSGSQDYTNEANYSMYGFAAPGYQEYSGTSNNGGNSNQNSSGGAEVVSSFPVSDPNSHFGLGGSYNLYTPNETKAALNIMLAIGTGGLAVETGAAEALGSLATNKALIIPIIQAGAGIVEGIAKSYLGPDPEMGSSMFMNPVSDAAMNITGAIINGLDITGHNPLPSYP